MCFLSTTFRNASPWLPKMANDRTGSARDVCFEVLFQWMNDFCVVID